MTTDRNNSTSANVPRGQPVTTKSVPVPSVSTSSTSSVTVNTIVRSSQSGALRFTYDTADAARQRSNLSFNRGPVKVSTDK